MSVIQSKAIKMMQVGGPEVLQWVDIEVAAPGPDEVRVVHEAIGLNFIDVYFRKGVYPQPLPGWLGMEAAGVIESVGSNVKSKSIIFITLSLNLTNEPRNSYIGITSIVSCLECLFM